MTPFLVFSLKNLIYLSLQRCLFFARVYLSFTEVNFDLIYSGEKGTGMYFRSRPSVHGLQLPFTSNLIHCVLCMSELKRKTTVTSKAASTLR